MCLTSNAGEWPWLDPVPCVLHPECRTSYTGNDSLILRIPPMLNCFTAEISAGRMGAPPFKIFYRKCIHFQKRSLLIKVQKFVNLGKLNSSMKRWTSLSSNWRAPLVGLCSRLCVHSPHRLLSEIWLQQSLTQPCKGIDKYTLKNWQPCLRNLPSGDQYFRGFQYCLYQLLYLS